MPRNVIPDGGPAEYNRKECEPGLVKFWCGAGIAFVLTAALSIAAFVHESSNDDGRPDGTDTSTEIDTTSKAAQDAGYVSDSNQIIAGWIDSLVYDDLNRKAIAANDYVDSVGTPEAVAWCLDAVTNLEEVSAGSYTRFDCNP